MSFTSLWSHLYQSLIDQIFSNFSTSLLQEVSVLASIRVWFGAGVLRLSLRKYPIQAERKLAVANVKVRIKSCRGRILSDIFHSNIVYKFRFCIVITCRSFTKVYPNQISTSWGQSVNAVQLNDMSRRGKIFS